VKARFFLIALLFFPLYLYPQAGQKTYSLDETLSQLGATLNWEPFSASGTLVKGDDRLSFYAGSPGEQGAALFRGRDVLSLPLPYLEKGLLRFPEGFLTAVKAVFTLPVHTEPPVKEGHMRIAAIIIDPGHGGKDSGAVKDHTIGGKPLKSVEKDIVLSVSKGLNSLLTAAYPGKRILMTRTGDTFPSLEERVNIANTVPLKKNEAIIYISVHANASLSKSARGYEVWYLPPETQRELIDREKYAGSAEVLPILNDMLHAEFITESTIIGRFILKRFKESFGSRLPSRGLKAESWYVVRNTRMPAVLVELGFVSNSDDAKLMSNEEDLKLFAQALYKGIADFVAEFEK
jgi:N-acetylmuramoyl-L-alanine amidase